MSESGARTKLSIFDITEWREFDYDIARALSVHCMMQESLILHKVQEPITFPDQNLLLFPVSQRRK
jgi:hypothetical protein